MDAEKTPEPPVGDASMDVVDQAADVVDSQTKVASPASPAVDLPVPPPPPQPETDPVLDSQVEALFAEAANELEAGEHAPDASEDAGAAAPEPAAEAEVEMDTSAAGANGHDAEAAAAVTDESAPAPPLANGNGKGEVGTNGDVSMDATSPQHGGAPTGRTALPDQASVIGKELGVGGTAMTNNPSEDTSGQKRNKIYIGGLPSNCRVSDLKACFGEFGKIRLIELKHGYGFVEFETSIAAGAAVARYNEGRFLGVEIRVQISRGAGGSGPGRGSTPELPAAVQPPPAPASDRARTSSNRDRSPPPPVRRSPPPPRSEIPLRDRIDRDPRDQRAFPVRDPLPAPSRQRAYEDRGYASGPPPLPSAPGGPRGRDDDRMRDRDMRDARGGRDDDRGRGRDAFYGGSAGGPRDPYEMSLSSRGPPSSASGYAPSSRGRSPPPLHPSHLPGPPRSAPPYDYRSGPPPSSNYGPPPSPAYGSSYDSRGPPPPLSADPRIDPRDPRYDPRYDSRAPPPSSRYDPDPRGPPPPAPLDPRDARPGSSAPYYSSGGPPPRSAGGYRDDYGDPYAARATSYGSAPSGPYGSSYPPSADPYGGGGRGGPPPAPGGRFDDGYGREPPMGALPPRRPDPRADPSDPYARGYNAGPPRGRSPPPVRRRSLSPPPRRYGEPAYASGPPPPSYDRREPMYPPRR